MADLGVGAVVGAVLALAPQPAPEFHLDGARVGPTLALADGVRPVLLRYRFRIDEPLDLRVRVVRLPSGRTVRSWIRRADVPGGRDEIRWNGIGRRGRLAPDGRYAFRVGPVGGRERRAGRFALRGHAFPVAGPHGVRGGVGEFGAPRSGGRIHEGFDILADCGTPLVAARAGRVERRGYHDALYGHYVQIDGRGSERDFFYSHLPEPAPVRRGQRVKTGQVVGAVGQTGNARTTPCHLHFEVRVHGTPIDPKPLLLRWDRWS